MINKGYISSINEAEKTAIIIPQEARGTVTFPLVIPWHLRECLEIDMPVIYVTFPDNTGAILLRSDGEWNHKIYEELLVEGSTKVTNGITANGGITSSGGGSVSIEGDIKLNGSLTASQRVVAPTVKAGDISLSEHKHSGVVKGSDYTEGPL